MYACTKTRCDQCLMLAELCFCAELPRLETRTRVVLLMHAGERHKPSNTGRLANLCLPNSEVRYRGLREGPPMSLEGLVDEEHETWMLYFSPESVELTPELVSETKKPVRLLVPDGTWSQASGLGAKVVRRLAGVKPVKLMGGKPSNYRLRAEHDPNGMATFEAITRALVALEGPEVEPPLERIFRIMTDRTLWVRGKLRADEVFGGIPRKA